MENQEMQVLEENEDNVNLDEKLKHYFDGRIVRKDLTQQIKEGANVPVYVLEYLLGQYCSSDDELIEEGVNNVKNILANNFVRPDESQLILSKLRDRGSYSIIDKVQVHLDIRFDQFYASFSNLGVDKIPIADEYAEKYERLLGGNIWCMIEFEYEHDDANKSSLPLKILRLTPIQMPYLDLDEILTARRNFTKNEWIDVILRSTGMEPDMLDERVKWLMLARLIPLVENNYNLCELGPRGTGKSHIYKEISPNSLLVSGGQTTVANLFYNMRTKEIGLVGMWDCVAFDEVAGIKFKDNDGIAIMKDYMASGSFSRGRDEKHAQASMVFVGNINQSVDFLLKTSNLFAPFPPEMGNDSAFFDRMHSYIPGWEIPKYRPEFFTKNFGLITDYLAEFFREMRKRNYSNAFDEYFTLGNNFNQRDTIAVRKTVSGLIKILYPHGEYSKGDVEEILRFAIELRRRVKEQLKKIGGMEFHDVNLSYIDKDTSMEEFVTVPEQGGGKLIPEGLINPGYVYTINRSPSGNIGVYKLEAKMMNGSGKFTATGLGTKKDPKESVNNAFNYLKANAQGISGSINTKFHDYLMQVHDLNGIGMTNHLSLATFIALCSVALNKPITPSTVILGDMSLGGVINRIENLSDLMQISVDSGATKVLIPMSSSVDLSTVPPEVLSKLDIIFYETPEKAVMKALGLA
ncbi:MAG: protease Lon-related BREX system protein BrxL [Methanobrevibacter sp.]|uniref:protease Lon-related BREX system protein BrxL n=1 Tax=Methanobrevibacter sp. TaxID=66852 RepID=UPI0026DF1ED3|nr:protease Lon-related BREX system protein BrxL [Methanobrevibacter sp.]MDO5849460.1 protease Lon-related BREX system protein BrxL [Methanobrevibacter sp.]